MPGAGRGGEGRLEVMGATSPAKWGGDAQILGGNAHPEPLSNSLFKVLGYITFLPSFVFSTNKRES